MEQSKHLHLKMSSPIVRSTIQSCVLAAFSNLTAQIITAYRSEAPYTINWTPIVQFILFNALNCPPNFLWQSYLESAFPSTTTKPLSPPSSEKQPEVKTTLSLPNTLTKVALDQTLGAALNTLMFSFVMAGFKGATFQEAALIAQKELWPYMRAGWTLWPAVSMFNF
ncbi:hypothetical protein HYALB_00014006, partial [Hymenoscyphus albidus]